KGETGIGGRAPGKGAAVGGGGPGTVNSRRGNGTADLPIDAGLTGDPTANINVVIVQKSTNTPVGARAVGRLRITTGCRSRRRHGPGEGWPGGTAGGPGRRSRSAPRRGTAGTRSAFRARAYC